VETRILSNLEKKAALLENLDTELVMDVTEADGWDESIITPSSTLTRKVWFALRH
jgi:hypothetical protein